MATYLGIATTFTIPRSFLYAHLPPNRKPLVGESIQHQHLLYLFNYHQGSEIHSKPGIVAHISNPSTWEAEAGGSQVRGQPRLHSENVSKKKKKLIIMNEKNSISIYI
jgi:hypothetical protein